MIEEIKQTDKNMLQAGEVGSDATVVVETRSYTKSTYEFARYKGTTGKLNLQLVQLANGTKLRFWPDGTLYSSESKHYMHLLHATEKLSAYIIALQRVEFLKGMYWDKVPPEYIEKVLRVLVNEEMFEDEERQHWLLALGL